MRSYRLREMLKLAEFNRMELAGTIQPIAEGCRSEIVGAIKRMMGEGRSPKKNVGLVGKSVRILAKKVGGVWRGVGSQFIFEDSSILLDPVYGGQIKRILGTCYSKLDKAIGDELNRVGHGDEAIDSVESINVDGSMFFNIRLSAAEEE
jgi:hypothetical protein